MTKFNRFMRQQIMLIKTFFVCRKQFLLLVFTKAIPQMSVLPVTDLFNQLVTSLQKLLIVDAIDQLVKVVFNSHIVSYNGSDFMLKLYSEKTRVRTLESH